MSSKALSVSLAGYMLASSSPVVASELEESHRISASLNADWVSTYIWRGQNLGGISIQPGLGVEYRGFSLSAWGSSGFDKEDVKEVDVTLAWGGKGFQVGMTDYWFDNGPGYFHYASHRTAHVFEAHVGYDFGPVVFGWYTNIAGNDGAGHKGDRAYSSYIELSAPFMLGGLAWNAELGASPWKTSFYSTTGFSVVNIGLSVAKEFNPAKSCVLKLYAKGICNPRNEKGYLVAGVSFTTL